MDTISISNKKL